MENLCSAFAGDLTCWMTGMQDHWSRMCLQPRPNYHGHTTPHTDFLLRVGCQTTLGMWRLLRGSMNVTSCYRITSTFRTAPMWKTTDSTYVFNSVITLFNTKFYFFIRFPHVNNKFMRCHMPRHCDLVKEPKDMAYWESIRPSSVWSHYNTRISTSESRKPTSTLMYILVQIT
jgi:hypothetical protein